MLFSFGKNSIAILLIFLNVRGVSFLLNFVNIVRAIMESLKTVTGLLKTVIKASEAANAATESLSTAEEELVKFFNAMHQEISELEKESENQKIKIYLPKLKTSKSRLK